MSTEQVKKRTQFFNTLRKMLVRYNFTHRALKLILKLEITTVTLQKYKQITVMFISRECNGACKQAYCKNVIQIVKHNDCSRMQIPNERPSATPSVHLLFMNMVVC